MSRTTQASQRDGIVPFGPECCHPVQFWIPWRSRSPEAKLLEGLLMRALADAGMAFLNRRGRMVQPGGITPARRREARAWIAAGDAGVYSFDYCCQHLHLDPAVLRAAVANASDS
jgi:hypothetical protein